MNYLIGSSFFRLTNSLINQLCFKDIDIIKMDLNINSLSEVLDEAKYNSLFDPVKNIVVYNANFFGSIKIEEQEMNNLIDYLSNPNPDTCLVFITSDKIDYRKKAAKLLKDKDLIKDYNKISYYDLVDLTNKYIKDNKWSINKDIVNYIIKASNNNYDIACNEIDKMMLCFKDNPSLDDAIKIVSTPISDNVFKFVDAAVEKDSKTSLKLLDELKIYKVDPVVILMSLFKNFKQMLYYKIAITNNNDLKKVFKYDNLQDWQMRKIADFAKRYSLEELISVINLLASYDYKYKSGILDKDIIINTFILEFMN